MNDTTRTALEFYRMQRGVEPDRNWKAMLILVTASKSLWEKVEPHLDYRHGNAWLNKVQKQEYLSGGEAALLSLSRNLYNGDTLVDLAGLADTLDDDLWPAVLEALAVYRGQGGRLAMIDGHTASWPWCRLALSWMTC